MKFRVFLALLAVCIFGVRAVPAYFLESASWTKNRTVRMHLYFNGPGFALSDGFASWDDSAADALNTWNNYLAHMQFAVDHNSLLSPASSDADNSAFFSDTVYGDSWGSGVLAVTLLNSRNGRFTETDVIFNQKDWSWDSYRGLRRSSIDFHRVALHEFGHVVGLDHPDDHGQHVAAIMNSHVSDLDSLQADDINGAQSIYGNGPAYLSGNSAPVLLNLSTRGRIDTGDNVLIGGFVIQGSQPATVILRSIGHSLAAYGIGNAISDPVIELHDSTGRVIASNDDWISSPDAETIASYRLDPPNSIESALFITLNPGAYTAIVKGFENSTTPAAVGVGMVELYDLHLTNSRAGNISTRGEVLLNDEVMIGGFIVGSGPPKDLVIRAIGPSLASSGVSGVLADPTLELHDANGAVIAYNDDWQQDVNAAGVSAVGLAPKNPKESALRRTLAAGGYTAIVRGANNATGVALVEVFDQSPSP
jgi:matrixin